MVNDAFMNVYEWYRELSKGDWAKLRRCKTLQEIFLQPAYVLLCRKLNYQGEKIALIAGIFSHMKEGAHIEDVKFARQMAGSKKGKQDSPRISPRRFQRLLAIENGNLEQLFYTLIRITKQLEKFNIIEFAKDLYYWNEITKKNWAYEYYSKEVTTSTNTEGEK